jgi:hypothetical protein
VVTGEGTALPPKLLDSSDLKLSKPDSSETNSSASDCSIALDFLSDLYSKPAVG